MLGSDYGTATDMNSTALIYEIFANTNKKLMCFFLLITCDTLKFY